MMILNQTEILKKQLFDAHVELEERAALEIMLKKDNLDYKKDIHVSRDDKGEYIVKKNIKLITID